MGKWTNDTTNHRAKARETLMKDWQARWDSSNNGRWTYRLVKNIETWHKISNPELILSALLKSKENWPAVREFVRDIMTKKEEEERRRQKL